MVTADSSPPISLSHGHHVKSGSPTWKSANASALASMSSHSSCWTWASLFLLSPSFYLRVASANTTVPSKAANTMSFILFWSNLRVRTQISLIYDVDVTIFSNYQIDWFSKWVIPNYCITFLNLPSYFYNLTKMGRFIQSYCSMKEYHSKCT
jgi:hypothetical protein